MKDKAEDFALLSGATERAIDALRSSGYRNTAMALGELVDNSVQAGATKISIIAEVEKELRNERNTWRIKRLATLDNGHGMDKSELRQSLVLGAGTHYDDTEGMGKFGVGLPQASISQGKLIKAYSWRNGPENAISTQFDLDDGEWKSKGAIIPMPEKDSVPAPWIAHIDPAVKTGTLVIWSKLDRLSWNKSKTLYENSEFPIGRMYRKWLNEGRLEIKMVTIEQDTGKKLDEKPYRAVDPLYLMNNTSVCDYPPKDDSGNIIDPMFTLYSKENLPIELSDGSKTYVTITTSIAKKETRRRVGSTVPGKLPHGKHAARNVGLSIVREGRELELDPNWTAATTDRKDPRHRWWGAQIEFKRDLDDVFGVPNNKQRADKLSEVVNTAFEDFIEGNESDQEIKNRLKKEDFNLYTNLLVADRIRKLIKKMYENIPDETLEDGTCKGTNRRVAEKEAGEGTEKRKEQGFVGASDEPATHSIEQRKKELVDGLKDSGYSDEEIDEITQDVIDCGYKYSFCKKKIDTSAFFSVESEGGALIVALNKSHPMFEELFGIFKIVEEKREFSQKELKDLATCTHDSMKRMLAAWARMEDEATGDRKSSMIANRRDWGTIIESFRGTEPNGK